MFGDTLLNARQVARKLGVSYTYFFKLIDNGCPYHQLTQAGRKYYVFDEVKTWLLAKKTCKTVKR